METQGHWAAPSRALRVRCSDPWASLPPRELKARAPNTARAPSAPCRPLLHLRIASSVQRPAKDSPFPSVASGGNGLAEDLEAGRKPHEL